MDAVTHGTPHTETNKRYHSVKTTCSCSISPIERPEPARIARVVVVVVEAAVGVDIPDVAAAVGRVEH